jgi:hypothetical protein
MLIFRGTFNFQIYFSKKIDDHLHVFNSKISEGVNFHTKVPGSFVWLVVDGWIDKIDGTTATYYYSHLSSDLVSSEPSV